MDNTEQTIIGQEFRQAAGSVWTQPQFVLDWIVANVLKLGSRYQFVGAEQIS